MIVSTPLLRQGIGAIPFQAFQAEAEALWQLKDRNFSQLRRELGVGYRTLRRLVEREIDEET